MKHLKQLKHRLATYVFHLSSARRSAEQGGGATGSGQSAAEDGDAVWQRLAAPTLGLGPASDVPLS